MRRQLLVLAAIALPLMAPFVASGQQAVSPAAAPALDTLAAQLVELELQRVASPGSLILAADGFRDADSQITALHERLRALPEGTAADREATRRVVLALDARSSSVQARLQQLRLAYTDTHPVVRQAESEERAIGERLSEIRGAK